MDRFLQYSIQDATASAGIPRLKQSCKGWFWTGVLVGSAGATLLIALIQH